MSNGNENYKLGELSADIRTLKEDVSQIKQDVRALRIWKAKVLGISSTVGAIAGSIFTMIIRKL